jgi:predicted RNA-binding Zn-ribbon protein involved in translation (DUF1610 family)
MHSSEASERTATNACRHFSGGLIVGMILVFSSFYLNGGSSFFSTSGKNKGQSSRQSSTDSGSGSGSGNDVHTAGKPVDGTACAAASLLRYQELKERARTGRFAGTPLLLDILHSEDQCRNVPGVIPPSYTDHDICYLITVEDHSLYWMRTLNKTWFNQVPWENIFAIGHTDDPTLRMTSNEKYKSNNNAWGTRHDALFEKFYDDSDGIEVPICRICGRVSVVNEKMGIYKCKSCGDNADIVRVASSWVSRMFMHESSAMNIDMTMELKPHTYDKPQND